MEKIHLMPLQGPRDGLSGNPVTGALYKLAQDARSWITAEAVLAQAELASDGRRVALIVALATAVIGCAASALMLFSLFVLALLAPHVGGLANAAGILAGTLAVVAVGASWWILHLVRSRFGIMSVLKRWSGIVSKVSGGDE
jgi:hypothetical protein